MYRARVIPCLLVQGNGLVKTKQFGSPVYLGDPVNTMRIFSEKEVDEIVVLDIDASRENREPNYALIEEMAGEAFMPVAYGGGIRKIEQVRRLIRLGIEKVVINTSAFESLDVIREAADVFGSQAIVGCVDVRKASTGGYRVLKKSGTVDAKVDLYEHIEKMIEAGIGELFLNNIDRDGMMNGYDLELIKAVGRGINIPLIACGGAGKVNDFNEAINAGASAISAGSIFVFYGKHKAVLITYNTDQLQ
jgi:imidazole glycerol-phosphate synthase subunit HisF